MPYVPAPAFTPAAWDTANPTEESADADTTPRVSRRPTPVKGAKMKLVLWIAIGLVLQLAAVGIWIFMFQDSEPEEEPTPPPTKTAPVKPGKKKQVKE
jgi:flagellar basal body-associated protein FliL